MSITCSMSWIPRREHRPCERALFAPLNDGENGECAFVFNSIFHHICGCHAVHKIFLVPDLKSVARGLGGHSRKCPPMTFFKLNDYHYRLPQWRIFRAFTRVPAGRTPGTPSQSLG